MLRPLDTHAIRVLEANLTLTPPGATRWTSDAYSNSVCHFTPRGESALLQVISTLLIERYPHALRDAQWAPPLFPANALAPPVVYSSEEVVVLAPFVRPFYAQDAAHSAWLNAQRWAAGSSGLDLLLQLNAAIHEGFSYAARDEYGTLSPAETILRGSATCRDFAWLMIESARRWGFAARFVTGYLYAPRAATRGAQATHAWCEIYLPDLGWLEFDPTNGLSESADLIRVAATRTPWEASPVSGVALGPAPGALSVAVHVEPDED